MSKYWQKTWRHCQIQLKGIDKRVLEACSHIVHRLNSSQTMPARFWFSNLLFKNQAFSEITAITASWLLKFHFASISRKY